MRFIATQETPQTSHPNASNESLLSLREVTRIPHRDHRITSGRSLKLTPTRLGSAKPGHTRVTRLRGKGDQSEALG